MSMKVSFERRKIHLRFRGTTVINNALAAYVQPTLWHQGPSDMATSLCSLATSSHTLLNNNSPFNEMYDLRVLIYKTMAPLSKSKSYTDLITSMGVGDSEPDEERILTTLARHMAKVGAFESGLTKHMNQVR
ncbi:hypothetical protein AFGD_001352 [Aspergillus flavus]|nr:hypothetical protein AFGD_001352 [Aspergillus flavus]